MSELDSLDLTDLSAVDRYMKKNFVEVGGPLVNLPCVVCKQRKPSDEMKIDRNCRAAKDYYCVECLNA